MIKYLQIHPWKIIEEGFKRKHHRSSESIFSIGNGRFGHPEQDRAISLREGAILQSFPEDYEFVEEGGDYCFKTIGRLIGNAVPVRLGEVVGETIRRQLSDYAAQ